MLDLTRVSRAPVVGQIRSWSPRSWIVAVLAAVIAALATGIPTDVVPTSLFTRMTPVRWWDYPLWAGTAILTGLIAATYTEPAYRRDRGRKPGGRVFGAGLLAVLAVGCPVCNKLVVLALGVTGSLTYFAPIQPLLGGVALLVLAATLVARLRRSACPAHLRS